MAARQLSKTWHWLACIASPDIAGRDTITGDTVRIFDPRRDEWSDHFEWRGADLHGRTPIGRVTVLVLEMNALEFRTVRAALQNKGMGDWT
jgi:hypothetical protein